VITNQIDHDVQMKVKSTLAARGLREGHDFFLMSSDNNSAYTVLQLTAVESISTEIVSGLYMAVKGHERSWGLLICAFDIEKDDCVPMVEISGGGLSYISGGSEINAVVREVFAKMSGLTG